MVPECYFVVSEDGRAKDVKQWVEQNGDLNPVPHPRQAKIIVVASGDGGLMRTAKKLCGYKIPLLGINRGTVGFMLNPIQTKGTLLSTLEHFDQCSIVECHLLIADFVLQSGSIRRFYAMNDVYFNAYPGTECRGMVSGESYPKRTFSGDGLIVCTPAGSTAYNKNAGGSVLPLGKDLIGLVTNNPSSEPIRASLRSQEITVEFTKGRVIGHADSNRVHNVKKCRIMPSRKVVRLAFMPEYIFEVERYRR